VTTAGTLVRMGTIQQRIVLVRGEKVIIDADLAAFYGVPTKRLNEQIKRNQERFPVDFMFRLASTEKAEVVAKCDHLSALRFSNTLPCAFTEHGAIMAAGVLNSRRAIAAHKQLAQKISQLENRLADHDEQILLLVQAIRKLAAAEPPPRKHRIGFRGETGS
jgi:hypothetical protein